LHNSSNLCNNGARFSTLDIFDGVLWFTDSVVTPTQFNIPQSAPRALAEKFPGGPMKKNKTKNSTNKPPLLYRWRVRGRNGHTPRAYLKVTLHQSRINSEDLF